jgi:hypothetical protein
MGRSGVHCDNPGNRCKEIAEKPGANGHDCLFKYKCDWSNTPMFGCNQLDGKQTGTGSNSFLPLMFCKADGLQLIKDWKTAHKPAPSPTNFTNTSRSRSSYSQRTPPSGHALGGSKFCFRLPMDALQLRQELRLGRGTAVGLFEGRRRSSQVQHVCREEGHEIQLL